MAQNGVEDVFKKFDVNGDDKISIIELGSIVAALGGSVTPESELKLVLKIATERDGFINLKEFAAFHYGNTKNGEEESKDLHEAFDLYDVDTNGKISGSELFFVANRSGENCSLKDGTKMILNVDVDVDVDGDGRVKIEDFFLCLCDLPTCGWNFGGGIVC